MVPKEFRKSWCVTAGWVSLLEAAIWEAVAIYSIGVYGCTWDFVGLVKGVSTWSMLYVTYFMGDCRGQASALDLGYSIVPAADPTRNLQVWMWIYSIVTAVWIPASILLTVAALGEVRGRTGAMLYYPWVFLTATLVVIDLAGGIYHLVDVFNTMTPDDYARFTASKSWANLTTGVSQSGITSWLPSLYVSLYFFRLLVIWLLNVFLVIVVYKASNSVALYTTNYVQSSLNAEERKKTWKDKFYHGPDPALFEQQRRGQTTANEVGGRQVAQKTNENEETSMSRHELFPVRYKTDEFGIPIEELNISEQREGPYSQDQEGFSRSPYQPAGRVFDFTGRPVRQDSFNERWQGQDSPPPMASGVKVPPELNKFEPFSYMAGDQPQRLSRGLSRSSSKEYPPIPRPDYTMANRHGSLEYVPNRFKVPSPKRPLQSQGSYNYDPPTSPKTAPGAPRKPLVVPRSKGPAPIPEDPSLPPQGRYLPQQAIPNQQQQAYFTRQTSQTNNYNINKLY